MAKKAEVELFFGDGSYLFRFGLKQLEEHDEKCGPLGEVFARVLRGRGKMPDGTPVSMSHLGGYRHVDLRETVRLALIGGGQGSVNEQPVKVDAVKARVLVERYFDGRPMEENWKLAAAILEATCVGYEEPDRFQPLMPGDQPDEEVGEARPGKSEAAASDASTSQPQ